MYLLSEVFIPPEIKIIKIFSILVNSDEYLIHINKKIKIRFEVSNPLSCQKQRSF